MHTGQEPSTLHSPDALAAAGAALRAGRLAVIPTETVYGLAAAAGIPSALEALRTLGPAGQSIGPIAWHAVDPAEVIETLHITRPLHLRVIQRLCPGPIRLVVEVGVRGATEAAQRLGIPPGVIDHDGFIHVRIPDDPAARDILRSAKVLVVAEKAASVGLGDGPSLPPDVDVLAARMNIAVVVNTGPTRLGKSSTGIRLLADGRIQVLPGGAFDDRYVQRKIERMVLFVCTGNTCRSPMAEAIARDLAAREPGVVPTRVESAGVAAEQGAPITPEAQQALEEMGIDAARHRSTDITREMVLDAEVIYTMTRSHAEAVRKAVPSAAAKVRLLDPAGGDVPDPIGGPLPLYRETARKLKAMIQARFEEFERGLDANAVNTPGPPGRGPRKNDTQQDGESNP